jgi:hypothetical protein
MGLLPGSGFEGGIPPPIISLAGAFDAVTVINYDARICEAKEHIWVIFLQFKIQLIKLNLEALIFLIFR